MVAAPTWLRLSRRGSQCSGYQSSNGGSWTLISRQSLALPAQVQAGLVVTSHDADSLAVASFSSFSIAPAASN
jgi:regulation of enolase protein 1 (concanavalin A-like superfamily)